MPKFVGLPKIWLLHDLNAWSISEGVLCGCLVGVQVPIPCYSIHNNYYALYLAELQRFSTNGHAVFTNSEFSLKYIEVYGFDFDYTLAHYSKQLDKFIYEAARNTLIKKLNVRLMSQ